MSYQIGNFLIQIKNAALARKRSVVLPYSKRNEAIGKILVKEGFLESLKREEKDKKKNLVGLLRYEKRNPVLTGVTIISKPSLRVYQKKGMSGKNRGFGTLIVTTSKGIMSGKDAKKQHVGGELLCRVW